MNTAALLGQRVKTLREQRRWRQEELAKATGMTQPAISRIESGEVTQPRLSVLHRLAKALDVTVDYLAGANGQAGASPADPGFRVLAGMYAGLSTAGRKQLVDYASFLRTRSNKMWRGK